MFDFFSNHSNIHLIYFRVPAAYKSLLQITLTLYLSLSIPSPVVAKGPKSYESVNTFLTLVKFIIWVMEVQPKVFKCSEKFRMYALQFVAEMERLAGSWMLWVSTNAKFSCICMDITKKLGKNQQKLPIITHNFF